jgi:HEAT repeat protein
MKDELKLTRTLRWTLSVLLLALGLTVTWAWGQVANLGAPPASEVKPPLAALYAAWQPEAASEMMLFRSLDGGASWQPLALPEGATPVVWADDGQRHLAVALDDGTLLRSADKGNNWEAVAADLPVLSLAWDAFGNLYLGTDGEGVYRVSAHGVETPIAMGRKDLASARIVGLAPAEGRVFVATGNAVFYADNADLLAGGSTWTPSAPVPDQVSALVTTDRETVYAGTATTGIYKSTDAGQTWKLASEGLGLAAGQMVKITSLRADPVEPNVLYAAVDHVVGSTHAYASAAGTFATLDGGATWQSLAGPAFPEAKHVSSLVLVPGKPLYVQAVTSEGLQSYAPDVMRVLAALESDEPPVRAAAARELGLIRAEGVWSELLAVLDDPDPAVSLAAADALARINDPAAVSGLLVAIEHPSDQVRLGAVRALGIMQVEAAVEPLRTMLLQGEGLEISVTSQALGRIGSPSAIDALLSALGGPESSPRWHAAMAALEELGQPAVGPLVEMLGSEDLHARRNAAQALGWIGSSSAAKALVSALEDKDAVVRAQAAWALGEIGAPRARAALERTQSNDPETKVQAEAVWALSRLNAQGAGTVKWPLTWAPTLNRLQAARWLVLGLSLAGALWLVAGTSFLTPLPARVRNRYR